MPDTPPAGGEGASHPGPGAPASQPPGDERAGHEPAPPPPPYPPPQYLPPGYPPPPPPFGSGPGHQPPWAAAPARSPWASFGVRVAGWLIDWVISGVISAVVLVPMHAVQGKSVSEQGVVLSALVMVIYATALIGGRGQTVGMRAVRVKAVVAGEGAPVSYARALGRAVCEIAFAPLVIPWVLDMLFPLWDPRRQTIHDKVAQTVVVRV